jgi:hypothetical protein
VAKKSVATVQRESKPERDARKVNLEMTRRFGRWLFAQKYSASTHERYCRIARSLCLYLGNRALSTVTPMDIGDYLTETLPDRWADSYISDRLGPLIQLI